MTAMASGVGKDGMESHSFWSSSRKVDGRTSGLMDKACPSLTKQGPSSVKTSRSFTAYLKFVISLQLKKEIKNQIILKKMS